MATKHDKIVAVFAHQFAYEQRRLLPAFEDIGAKPDAYRSRGNTFTQSKSVTLDNGDGRRGWKARGGFWRWRPPDSAGDHIVQVVIVDEDLADGAGLDQMAGLDRRPRQAPGLRAVVSGERLLERARELPATFDPLPERIPDDPTTERRKESIR